MTSRRGGTPGHRVRVAKLIKTRPSDAAARALIVAVATLTLVTISTGCASSRSRAALRPPTVRASPSDQRRERIVERGFLAGHLSDHPPSTTNNGHDSAAAHHGAPAAIARPAADQTSGLAGSTRRGGLAGSRGRRPGPRLRPLHHPAAPRPGRSARRRRLDRLGRHPDSPLRRHQRALRHLAPARGGRRRANRHAAGRLQRRLQDLLLRHRLVRPGPRRHCPSRPGAASLVIFTNGTATVADWGRDASPGTDRGRGPPEPHPPGRSRRCPPPPSAIPASGGRFSAAAPTRGAPGSA